MEIDNLCPLCSKKPETLAHILGSCEHVMEALGFEFIAFPAPSDQTMFHEWWFNAIMVLDKAKLELLAGIIYNVWTNRNDKVHEAQLNDLLVRLAAKHLSEHKAAHTQTTQVLCSQADRTQAKWVPPPQDKLKINVEVATRIPGVTSLGVVVHDHEERAQELSLQGKIAQDCHRLCNSFTEIHCSWIYRQANHVAHEMSSYTAECHRLDDWSDMLPMYIRDLGNLEKE
ncbi:hypothetical protein Droror1_Dr00002479 [Drosera rotundifolia]